MVWGTGFAGGDTVFGNHLSDTQMAEVFTAAMSKGLNLWDTAAVYGMGSSETALGALVRQFPRENIIYPPNSRRRLRTSSLRSLSAICLRPALGAGRGRD